MLSSAASLSDWLTWLETLSPKEIDLGLERVQLLLERLQPGRPEHVLLVAGTNGKGSSVAMADTLLRASGKRVGAYTSPHVIHYNERIVVNGKAVDDKTIITAFEQVEAARADTELTYFEFGTLAAVVIFAAADLDVWLLEVGLGGRLDATNAIDPTASLITNVSLDHCDWLGDDIETIAVQKAGVMRSGRPTVFGAYDAPDSIVQQAEACGATLMLAGVDFDLSDGANDCWNWRAPGRALEALHRPGLLGEFQVGNASAVLMLLEAAGLAGAIDARLVNSVLPAVSLTGRSERLTCAGVEWLLDVAHNPAAAEMLAATLAAMEGDGKTIAIVGLLDDKNVAGVIEPLATHVSSWIAMTADSHRAVPAHELARQVANLIEGPCLVAGTAEDAIEFARRKASENDRILVTGSFFTVAPVISCLAAHPRTEI